MQKGEEQLSAVHRKNDREEEFFSFSVDCSDCTLSSSTAHRWWGESDECSSFFLSFREERRIGKSNRFPGKVISRLFSLERDNESFLFCYSSDSQSPHVIFMPFGLSHPQIWMSWSSIWLLLTNHLCQADFSQQRKDSSDGLSQFVCEKSSELRLPRTQTHPWQEKQWKILQRIDSALTLWMLPSNSVDGWKQRKEDRKEGKRGGRRRE